MLHHAKCFIGILPWLPCQALKGIFMPILQMRKFEVEEVDDSLKVTETVSGRVRPIKPTVFLRREATASC